MPPLTLILTKRLPILKLIALIFKVIIAAALALVRLTYTKYFRPFTPNLVLYIILLNILIVFIRVYIIGILKRKITNRSN